MSATCTIGVDLGGTKVLAGAVDDDLGVLARAHREVPRTSAMAVVDIVREAIEEVRGSLGVPVRAVGLGVPCLIDRTQGVVMASTHLPLVDVPFGALVSEQIGLPVVMDNDGNTAMLAEWRHGAARGATDAVLLTVGTGIAAGVVANGALVRGALGAGPEIGHMVIDADGPSCGGSCPNRGCLEAHVSGAALARAATELAAAHAESAVGRAVASGREVTGALVTELAHDGDAVAREAFDVLGGWLGVGIANVVNIFNPSVVVVGGGVMGAGELLLGPARTVLAERGLPSLVGAASVVPSAFGAESGMIGAALLTAEEGL